MIVQTGPMRLTSCPSASRRSQPALDRLGHRDRLRHGERDGRVDADAAVGGLLHRADAGLGGRDLHDDVGGQARRTRPPGRPARRRRGRAAGRSAPRAGRCGRGARRRRRSSSAAASTESSRTIGPADLGLARRSGAPRRTRGCAAASAAGRCAARPARSPGCRSRPPRPSRWRRRARTGSPSRSTAGSGSPAPSAGAATRVVPVVASRRGPPGRSSSLLPETSCRHGARCAHRADSRRCQPGQPFAHGGGVPVAFGRARSGSGAGEPGAEQTAEGLVDLVDRLDHLKPSSPPFLTICTT